jgi:hypothetical protein
MKIFWSWQSDHPGKVSRHFVREALEQAISELKQDSEVEEAARDAELDYDRKGVPGSPDLANTILEKIRGCAVFVADVTPVGVVTGNQEKRLINSNVAIELGYALSVVTDRALLMILNLAYGTHNDLPFDLRHKAGPITYSLSSTATKDEIEREKARLVGVLRVALREIVGSASAPISETFEEAQAAPDNPGRFFAKDEVIVHRGDMDFRCPGSGLIYVRVFPVAKQPLLSRTAAMSAVQNGRLKVLNDRATGWSREQNKFGVLVFESLRDTQEILSATQFFKSQEIWGFDAYVLSYKDKKGIPTGWHEYMIANALSHYVEFGKQVLGWRPPLLVEIGLTNVAGYNLFMDQSRYWDSQWGPIHESNIILRKKLLTYRVEELDAVLLEFFEMIFDAAGAKRPDRYNNFPGDRAGSLPHR